MNTQNQISLTKEAANAVLDSIREDESSLENTRLRVGANKGGCSGWRWELGTESKEEKKETDLIFESEGLEVIIDQKILNEVIGSVLIDYQTKNIVEQGFVFMRKTGQACGCGESFTPVATSCDERALAL